MDLELDGWGDGSEPVQSTETVLRRVPRSQMEGRRRDRITFRAFRPRQLKDLTGISLARQKYRGPEGVAAMPPRCPYVLAIVAEDVFRAGMSLVPDPLLPDSPGHCLLPELNSSDRASATSLRLQEELFARSRIVGPFAETDHGDSE